DFNMDLYAKLKNIADEGCDIKTLFTLYIDRNNEQQNILLDKLTKYENHKINLNKKIKSIAEIIIDEN
ncbi:TPA: hypothetical protein ACIVP0_004612, partial [Salmonella enterica subsp. diarizonae serovar 61:l,v:z35]